MLFLMAIAAFTALEIFIWLARRSFRLPVRQTRHFWRSRWRLDLLIICDGIPSTLVDLVGGQGQAGIELPELRASDQIRLACAHEIPMPGIGRAGTDVVDGACRRAS